MKARNIDQNNPDLHFLTIQFMMQVQTLNASHEFVRHILNEEIELITQFSDFETFNQKILESHPNSAPHIASR